MDVTHVETREPRGDSGFGVYIACKDTPKQQEDIVKELATFCSNVSVKCNPGK